MLRWPDGSRTLLGYTEAGQAAIDSGVSEGARTISKPCSAVGTSRQASPSVRSSGAAP